MKRWGDLAGNHALLLFAVAWPWGVYQYVPGTGLELTGVIALLAIFLAAIQLRWHRFPVPWELLWPTALVFMCLLPYAFRNDLSMLVNVGIGLVFYLAVMSITRDRLLIHRTLLCSAASLFALGLTQFAGAGFQAVPTAYELQTGAHYWGPYSMTGGLWTLLFGAVLCIALARSDPERSRGQKTALAAAGVALLGAAAGSPGVGVSVLRLWHTPSYGIGTISQAAALLAVLWLVARTAAKLTVDRGQNPGQLHSAFLALLAFTAVYALVLPVHPRLEHAFLLGLACAYANPRTSASGESAPVPVLSVALVTVLVAWNVGYVDPDYPIDPRNYEPDAYRDFGRGDLEQLAARLDYFDRISPQERRTHLWRARVALRDRDPQEAAAHFAQSLQETKGSLLPGPTSAEKQDFLVRLRDLCSALSAPERGVAYEYALVAADQPEEALAALRQRIRASDMIVVETQAAPLARRLAHMLGDAALAARIEEWSASELGALLRQIEGRTEN